MKTRPVIQSLAMVLAASSVAVGAAALGGWLFGDGPIASSAIAVAVITLLFAWRPAEGLAAFGLLVLLDGTVAHWFGTDLQYLDEMAIPTLILAAAVLHRSRIRLPRPGLREAGLGLLLIAAVASTLINAVPPDVWLPGLALLVKGFVFFYLVTSLRFGEDELRRISGVFLIVGLVITAIGWIQFIDPSLARGLFNLPNFEQQRGEITVVNSVFTHPALYGWLTAVVSLFLYARFAIARSWPALVLAIAVNAGTLISGRRTPVISVAAALVVGFARQVISGRVTARIWAAVAVGVLMIGLVSVPLLGEFYLTTLDRYVAPRAAVREAFEEEPEAWRLKQMQPRVALYVSSLAIGRDYFPLGTGIGRFGSHMSREVYSPVYKEYGLQRVSGLRERKPIAVTDTFWPMILGETGVLGLAGLLLFVGALGRDLWRAAGREARPMVRIFSLGALLVFVETIVRSSTSAVFVAPPVAYFVFGIFALALTAEGADAPAAADSPMEPASA
ncbi:MAG TPA: hypothetical protein VF364_03995 [Candidatus Limnocylindria bacterium]